MNLFDLLLRKKTEQNKTIDFKPLVKDPLADSTGYRADGSMAQAQELPLVQINNDNTATTQQWQEHKKPTFGQRVGEMLFGKQAQATDSVNTENPLFNMITAKTDDWKKQGISDEAIQGVAQGLNSGNKELAQFITDNKINTPKTAEEIALAKEGKFNNYTPVAGTISENPRVGGALPNFINGYRENTNNGFNLENWTNNMGLDGHKKGLAYRVGEGLGTAARFLDSPFGRGLLTAGIVSGTGGSGLEALVYGGNSGVLNQNLRTNDKLYRNELKQTYQQSIMNDPRYSTLTSAEDKQIQDYIKQSPEYLNAKTDEERATIAGNMYNSLASEKIASKQNEALQEVYANIDGLRGYIDKNAFGSMVQAQQLRDNAGYRNMMLNNQQRQNEIMNALRQDQLKAQQQQQAFNQWYQKASLEDKRADRAERRAYQNAQLGLTKRGQDLNYQLGQDRIKANQNKKMSSDEKQQTLNQLDKMMELFNELPQSKTIKGLQKGRAVVTGVSNMLGGQNDKETAFNSIRPLMVSRVMRKLQEEKGVATDKDFERASAMVPSSFDSPQQAAAKVETIKKMFANTNTQNNQAAKTHNNYKEGQTAINRKTGEKLIYRGGKWKKL